MLRLILTIGIVGAIYVKSPLRPDDLAMPDLSRLPVASSLDAIAALAKTGLGPALAETALRRTLDDFAADPKPSTPRGDGGR